MPGRPKQITIALDGFSSCGKSTLAHDLARKLEYLHIDSGAMYRAVTLYVIRHEIDIHDEVAIGQLLSDIRIEFVYDDTEGIQTILNGENVERDIRALAVNSLVSPIAAISSVRRTLVAQQRKLGAGNGIVMDGRDIGTVVFPQAELKLFLQARLDVRIERRFLELMEKGITVSRDQIAHSITERDEIDSTRADSPLRMAEDAVVIDNTDLTREAQLKLAHDLAVNRIYGANTTAQ